ncbi:hypothetical protein [Stenotrophomonas sp.]|uniref:hypothetical protein n=1 Tax=Stenotrophomonas sp. TaxID=69392 RepID=UPI00289CAB8E|nr:hypothetical protein [Stenotrophomonas sp.]
MHVSEVVTPAGATGVHGLYWFRPESLKIRALYDWRSGAKGEELCVPSLFLRGMWMSMAGLEVGSRVVVSIAPGRVLLTLAHPPVGAASRFASRRTVLHALAMRRKSNAVLGMAA